jgi:L-cysteine desulfidase
MIGDVSGIICDGASGCSMKVSTSTSAAVKSSLMAINNLRVPQSEGIVSDDVDQTIANLGRLSREDAGYRHRDHQHHAGQAAG